MHGADPRFLRCTGHSLSRASAPRVGRLREAATCSSATASVMSRQENVTTIVAATPTALPIRYSKPRVRERP